MIRELGRGSWGVVYLAVDPELKRQVAIKTLHIPLSEKGDRQRRLIQERKIVGRLQHPNIIPVYEAGECNGRPYLVFEYAEGRSLRELINSEGPLPVHRAVHIMRQVLEGTAYAHRLGILHCNLRPSNILISKKDNPRIMDFGISIMTEGKKKGEKDPSGTTRTMSPEHLTGNPVSYTHLTLPTKRIV